MRTLVKGMIVVILAVVCTSTPASAALVIYRDANYAAYMGERSVVGWWNMSAGNNDNASSYQNDTGYSASFWHDANKSGGCFTVGPGTSNANLAWSGFNDAITSYGLQQPGC